MKVFTEGTDKLVITGEMKTIEDYTTIKSVLSDIVKSGVTSTVVEIRESMTITSSIIGLFTKTIHGDGLKLSLYVHSDKLYGLLEDLNLITVFNVKKI